MQRLILPLVVIACFSSVELSAATVAKPNIVYILCDDLGYGDVQCLNPTRGKILTPNIDRLASQGMIFTDAHSSSSVCTPTRYSILTGRYNWRTRLQSGVLNGFSPPLIAAERLTVAGLLQQQGYATACIGKWHLGMTMPKPLTAGKIDEAPTSRGFEHYFGISASLDMPPYAWIENDRFTESPTSMKELYPNRRGEAAPSFTSEAVLPKLAEKSAAWIREHKERPFFLYLPLNSPHTPLNPNQAWRGKSGLGSYADFVMETDWLVGEIMRTLDETKLADQTLVIFTSDNGCAPYVGTSAEIDPMPHGRGDVHSLEKQGHYPSGDLRGYKSDIWEGGHRVPFIVRWPQQVPAGSRCTQLVGQLDLMATCAEITGAKLPENAAEDSVSILPLLQGKNVPVRESLVHHSIQGAFAIRQGNWKLALCRGSGGWSAGGDDHSTQLYDLSHDLGEQTNLAAAQPEMVARLTNLSEKQVADGRSTPGTPQKNDAEIVIRKPRDSREFKPARANKLP